jgi:phospholipid/cholesterol/gamma-HCH transport system substrate-binding protein
MQDRTKNILIGLFALVAFGIIIFVLLFLHPTTGDEGQTVVVRFANIDKVSVGTRVTFGGRPVGEVVDIQELSEGDTRVSTHKGKVYIWQLTLKVDSHVPLYQSDEISLKTSGLLGEKSVAITPMPIQAGELLEYVSNRPLYANESGSIDDTVKDVQNLTATFSRTLDAAYELLNDFNKRDLWAPMDRTLKNVDEITTALNEPEDWNKALKDGSTALSSLREGLDQLKEDETWQHISATAKQIDSISNAINKPEELSKAVDNLCVLTERINDSWSRIDGAIDTIAQAATSLKNFSATSDEIIVNVSKGQGSIGQLFVKDEFYLQLASLLSKAETTLDDINHYGLLFHLDKGWQRLRARRANLLQTLSTPQQFRNYFNDEIDQISTSLSRVYLVLRKIEAVPGCFRLDEDPEFAKVFAELLRRTGELEDNLQMYNQQTVDAITERTELCP